MLRLVIVGLAIAGTTAALLPVQWLAMRFGWPMRRRIPVLYHRALCRLVGIRTQVCGAPAPHGRVLIVANHCSWLDITVLVAQHPVVFVAKSEVAGWPLFGLLARLNRTVFVERARRQAIGSVNEKIAARLHDGDPVVLFAEGTSSDGNRTLPFRSSLVGAAHLALAENTTRPLVVQPLAIAYARQGGVPLGRGQRPRVAWYGDMDLLSHLAGIVRRGALDAVVAWGEPVAVDAATDRKALTRDLEDTVRRMLGESL